MAVITLEVRDRHPIAMVNFGCRIAFLLAVLVYSQGCAALLAVGSVAGFGATYYQSTITERTFTTDLPRVWDASLRALDGMSITVAEKKQEACRGEIQGATHDLKVDIVLTAITPIVTQVKVDVVKPYLLKDTATAKEIVEQINRDLEEGRARKILQKAEFRAADPPCQMAPVDGVSAAAAETSPGRAVEFVEIKVPAGNVRAAASMDSKILATLPRGTKLEKIADGSSWVKVRLSNGTEGFIIPRLVQEVKASPPPARAIASVPPSSIHLAEDPGGTR